MPLYDVTLTRSYIVKVNAEDADKAKHVAEFYLGDPLDLSLAEPQLKLNKDFEINGLELVFNEAMEISYSGVV